jgi:hypothetical protein
MRVVLTYSERKCQKCTLSIPARSKAIRQGDTHLFHIDCYTCAHGFREDQNCERCEREFLEDND